MDVAQLALMEVPYWILWVTLPDGVTHRCLNTLAFYRVLQAVKLCCGGEHRHRPRSSQSCWKEVYRNQMRVHSSRRLSKCRCSL
ncbi:uncharacterized protein [Malus domestica]|uniref:uncharacterized protein isoform X3 n=1 Tax=Malus domestica TaxID=3750 RepID=UPI0039747275